MHPRSLLLLLKPKISLDSQAYLAGRSFTKNKTAEHGSAADPLPPGGEVSGQRGEDQRCHHINTTSCWGTQAWCSHLAVKPCVTPVQTGTAGTRGFKSVSTYILVEGIICIFASQRQIRSMDIIQQLPRCISYM